MSDRKPLREISYGMYIVTAKDGDRANGQMSNTVFQVTSEPPALSVCINKQNTTHDMIERGGVFTVSVLNTTAPLTLISVFGFKHGKDVDKLKGVDHRQGNNGAPIILDNTNAYIEAKVRSRFDAGTHTVFVGQVTDMGLLEQGDPMTYDYYHRVLKGVTPKAAPTYLGPNDPGERV